jgi:hypothetical protein
MDTYKYIYIYVVVEAHFVWGKVPRSLTGGLTGVPGKHRGVFLKTPGGMFVKTGGMFVKTGGVWPETLHPKFPSPQMSGNCILGWPTLYGKKVVHRPPT